MELVNRISGAVSPQPGISGTIGAAVSVSGNIATGATVTGSIQKTGGVVGLLSGVSEIDGVLSFTGGGRVIPVYSGDYEVTPKARNQTILKTEGREMLHDVTVLAVPYYETSNIHDGETVYIASEV